MNLYDIRQRLNTGKTIFDIPMRVAFYARVSTNSNEQAHSLASQVKYYSEFIRNNPNWTFVEGYIDEGLSGASVNKRESFLRMVDDARLRKFDLVITKEISRFSRNTVDSLKYTQELLSYGVGVFFQSDNINTLYSDSELRLTIMSSIAQEELRRLSERLQFGFKRSVENGRVLGKDFWGYKKDNCKLVIVEEEAEMIRKVFDLYAYEGMGLRSICQWLANHGYKNTKGGEFCTATIRSIINNPKYKGYYCGGKAHKYTYASNDRKYLSQDEWVMYKDEETVPPIVSEEVWDRANEILKERSAKISGDNRTSYQNSYPYSGKIICMEHNVPYHRAVAKWKNSSKEFWRCRYYAQKGKKGCDNYVVYTSEIDEIMKDILTTIIQDKESIIRDLIETYSDISTRSKIREDIAKLKLKITEIVKMKDKLLELSVYGKINNDEFEVRNNDFNKSISDFNSKIDELLTQDVQNEDFMNAIHKLRRMISGTLSFENGIDENILIALLDRIEVYKTDVENEIKLLVYLSVSDEPLDFDIKRHKRQKKGADELSFCDTHSRTAMPTAARGA